MLPPLKEILQFRRPNVVDDEKKKNSLQKKSNYLAMGNFRM